MSHATLDRVLAVLVVAMAGTGLLSLGAGAAEAAWVFTVHALLGGSLFAATAWKLWRSVPRAMAVGRWWRLSLGLLVSLLTVAALTGGFLWVASGELLTVGSWTVLTLHAWVGLALVPLVAFHLLPARWRLLRPLRVTRASAAGGGTRPGLSRRSLLAGGGLALAGVGAFAAAGLADAVRGGVRRFTGSRWLPSGGIPPPTTFYGEGPPSIDPDGWRLTVIGADGGATAWSLEDVRALDEVERDVVLDCTSGWAMDTRWRGVPITSILDVPDRGSLRVTSATGWTALLTAAEARAALLATGVAGKDLPVANGWPCRLVIPGRRGLAWVKWVVEVRVA